MIKLVTFDALHTLITPRKPIHVQYSEVFAPYLGLLHPSALQHSFEASLKQIQKDKPAYHGPLGAHGWWSEVIKRTAIGAGADPQAVEVSLDKIVSRLMDRFSSNQGYRLFNDTLPVRMSSAHRCHLVWCVMHEAQYLQEMNIRTALISNSDARMRLVLVDLGISPFFRPLVLSEEEGVEKPSAEIFRRAFEQGVDSITPLDQGVHVGDELQCDYYGAQRAGMQALLIRRPSPEGDQENKEADEDLGNVRVISSLHHVVGWVRSHHKSETCVGIS